jgi:hypothetical protein
MLINYILDPSELNLNDITQKFSLQTSLSSTHQFAPSPITRVLTASEYSSSILSDATSESSNSPISSPLAESSKKSRSVANLRNMFTQ